MNQLARSLLLLLVVAGCHFADVDALQRHMIEECHVAPVGPVCASLPENEDAGRLVFERFARREITSQETERCILDVDCSDERVSQSDPIDELLECLAADPAHGVFDRARRDVDADCANGCDLVLQECGEPGCGPWEVTACMDAHTSCLDACRAS
ncbi:MAG: hypothetical protein Q8O67_23490 [Deltaproteobacteria bacterium]|nr:hypothetical protein [Deltaproteobacteria bacterium]